jgi:hypothetical protein
LEGQKLKELTHLGTQFANSGRDAHSLSEGKRSAAIQIKRNRLAIRRFLAPTVQSRPDRRMAIWGVKQLNQQHCFQFRIECHDKLLSNVRSSLWDVCFLSAVSF